MRDFAIDLGRPFGIQTKIHGTFALILAWVAFDAWRSSASLIAVGAGLALTLGVFASVLLHELGHSLTARRFGIDTREITLYPIGGVARLEGTPTSSRSEFWIALAGPAVNVAIAAVLALATLTVGPLFPPFAAGFVTTLMWANVGLALFNLLPAFPMDGGRIFRALLQRHRGRLRATEVAATVGKAFALLFAVAGLLYSPMLLLIAVFVWLAADSELRQTRRMAEMATRIVRDPFFRAAARRAAARRAAAQRGRGGFV